MFATDSHVWSQSKSFIQIYDFTCPVGAYYSKPVRVKVETKYTRAAAGGTGAAKATGNYAGALYPTNLQEKRDTINFFGLIVQVTLILKNVEL